MNLTISKNKIKNSVKVEQGHVLSISPSSGICKIIIQNCNGHDPIYVREE